MTCEEWLDRILEADPKELRGKASTELARHIDGCPRCGPVAATILRELDAVDAALARYAEGRPLHATDPAADHDAGDRGRVDPHVAADAATDAALAAVRGTGRPAGAGAPTAPPRRTLTTRWTRAAWIPLAAAAALAAVMLLGRDDPFAGTGPGPAPGERAIAADLDPRVSVNPPTDRAAAIMETGNPDITIVWLYEREGT